MKPTITHAMLALLALANCATTSLPFMLRRSFDGSCIVESDTLQAHSSNQATPRPRGTFTAGGNTSQRTVSVFFYREDVVRVLGDQVEWVCGESAGVSGVRARWSQSVRGPDTVEESADWVVPVDDFARGCVVGRERWIVSSKAEREVVRPMLAAVRDPATRCE